MSEPDDENGDDTGDADGTHADDASATDEAAVDDLPLHDVESFDRSGADTTADTLDADEARAALAEALAEEVEALRVAGSSFEETLAHVLSLDDSEGDARDDLDDDGEPSFVDADETALDAGARVDAAAPAAPVVENVVQRHLRGLLESLLFVADRAMKNADLAEIARADGKEVRVILEALADEYRRDSRGFLLDELAGGWQLRTSPTFAPFVRELTKQKPVRLTRAQVETLAIVAYRQPITRPEVEDIRGVDAGPVMKLLLDRDLVRVLGKKDEPGRPLLYGTTTGFLTFFGLKSLRDLPTLREFTELSDESRDTVERELGDVLPEGPQEPATKLGDATIAAADVDPFAHDAPDAEAGEASVSNDDPSPVATPEASSHEEPLTDDESDDEEEPEEDDGDEDEPDEGDEDGDA